MISQEARNIVFKDYLITFLSGLSTINVNSNLMRAWKLCVFARVCVSREMELSNISLKISLETLSGRTV